MAFFLNLIIALAFMVIAYLIMPKPKVGSGAKPQELENPTAEASKVLGVVFGTLFVKDPNVLWFGEKNMEKKKVSA